MNQFHEFFFLIKKVLKKFREIDKTTFHGFFLTGLFEMFWPIVYLQIKLYTICVRFRND